MSYYCGSASILSIPTYCLSCLDHYLIEMLTLIEVLFNHGISWAAWVLSIHLICSYGDSVSLEILAMAIKPDDEAGDGERHIQVSYQTNSAMAIKPDYEAGGRERHIQVSYQANSDGCSWNVNILLVSKRRCLATTKARQFEEGLRGSWHPHPGVVVDVADLCRSVTYDELLDIDGGKKLTERINVTSAIEGKLQRRQVRKTYRGRIGPLPPQPQPSSKLNLNFGTCVDVFVEDAWWEGVVLDPGDDLMTCLIYFPDEAIEGKYKVSDLRLSLEWDEFLDGWKEPGIRELVNLVTEHRGDAYLVKAVWHRLWSKGL